MTTPRVSIVLSTRNRAGFLTEALRSHERIVTDIPWELVVVDNGSTDATPQVLREFARETRIVFRSVVESRPGLSCARNTGWRTAAGDLVAFTDDDCYPAPDFVPAIAACFADAHLDYLGGQITLHDPDDAPVTIQLRDTPLVIEPHRFVPAGLIQGANMAARRRVLETLDGFDELLGAGTPYPSEDIDFVSRASAAGFNGTYDPRPVVAHHHRRRTAAEIESLHRSYDVGRGAYYAKSLLDPLRRSVTWRAWAKSLVRSVMSVPSSARARAQLVGELRGAFGYLKVRRNEL